MKTEEWEEHLKVRAKYQHICPRCSIVFNGRKTRKYCSVHCARVAGGLGQRRKNQGRLEVPTIRDIVWAAGIFEGEGCILRHGKYDSQRIIVSQKDPWLPSRLHTLFGGGVREARSGVNKTHMHYWTICGARARGFAFTIYQFLSPRRQGQIRVAIGL